MVMCVAQKIGPIKASLIHWNGTTGEDLRRARGARPPLAGMIRGGRSSETSNKCFHGLPEVRPSTGYNKTFGAQRPQPLQELAKKRSAGTRGLISRVPA